MLQLPQPGALVIAGTLSQIELRQKAQQSVVGGAATVILSGRIATNEVRAQR
jgi:hypothetical protein